MGNAHWLVVWCSFGARVLITGVAGAPHLRMSDARIARLDTYPHVILCQQMQTFDMAMRSHGRRLFDILFFHVCIYTRFLFGAVLQVRYFQSISSLPSPLLLAILFAAVPKADALSMLRTHCNPLPLFSLFLPSPQFYPTKLYKTSYACNIY